MTLANAVGCARQRFSEKVLDLWYANDGYILRKLDEVISAFENINKPLESIGLNINRAKCALWFKTTLGCTLCTLGHKNNLVQPTIANIQLINIKEHDLPLVLLGYLSAGNKRSNINFAISTVKKTETALEPLELLGHAQGEACIVRACDPTSRLRHILRFSVNDDITSELYKADNTTTRNIERIAGRPLPPRWKYTAAKPAASEGVGFRLLKDIDSHNDCRLAIESIRATVEAAAESDRVLGLNSELMLSALEAAGQRPFPAESTGGPSNAPLETWQLRLINESNAAPYASEYLIACPGSSTSMNNTEFRGAL